MAVPSNLIMQDNPDIKTIENASCFLNEKYSGVVLCRASYFSLMEDIERIASHLIKQELYFVVFERNRESLQWYLEAILEPTIFEPTIHKFDNPYSNWVIGKSKYDREELTRINREILIQTDRIRKREREKEKKEGNKVLGFILFLTAIVSSTMYIF